ncbi:MAG: hypothetical protein M1827_002949 [Pycnora praestabilis]|nr:MAG: hypothetical protein M1827_002949 [Pycnora praestabilis]
MVDQVLVTVWACTWSAMVIMVFRLGFRKFREEKFKGSDYMTMGAMFCLITRLALIHVVLVWGTNNVTKEFRDTHHFTTGELYRREVGSKLTIINRVFYNSFLWLQKLVLFEFYRRLFKTTKYEKYVLWSFWSVFAISYVVVQVVTFSECTPFDHYWIVLPDPGEKNHAATFAKKFGLFCLFCIGGFVVAITAIRLPQNFGHSTAQINRTTWASAESLASTAVANAPTLYVLFRRKNGQGSTGDTGPSGSSTSFGNKTPGRGRGGSAGVDVLNARRHLGLKSDGYKDLEFGGEFANLDDGSSGIELVHNAYTKDPAGKGMM